MEIVTPSFDSLPYFHLVFLEPHVLPPICERSPQLLMLCRKPALSP